MGEQRDTDLTKHTDDEVERGIASAGEQHDRLAAEDSDAAVAAQRGAARRDGGGAARARGLTRRPEGVTRR